MAVCEPTGGYERPLISQLEEAGFRIHLAHPNKVRSFARACGYEAKTDGLDAQVLSRFGQVFALADAPQSKPDPERAPNCRTCCGEGVSWSTSGWRNSTGWIKG